MPRLFGTDGIRGVANVDLKPPLAYALGRVLETGRFDAATVAALKARGHVVVETDLTSGLQAIGRAAGDGWFGGADPRRVGVVRGQ